MPSPCRATSAKGDKRRPPVTDVNAGQAAYGPLGADTPQRLINAMPSSALGGSLRPRPSVARALLGPVGVALVGRTDAGFRARAVLVPGCPALGRLPPGLDLA